MIQSVQKIIKIGSSVGVTLPAKELKRQSISVGNEVEVVIRPINTTSNDEVTSAAKKILSDYRQDFKNLASR